MKRTELKRVTPLVRTARLRTRPPRSKRSQGHPARWTDAMRCDCEVCGLEYQWGLEQHHVVYAQHVRAAGGDVWDPRNSLTACGGALSCHARHHSRLRPIPLVRLPNAAFEFASELFGPGAAYEYLRHRYFGEDPRLEALLEDWEMAA